MNLAGALSVFSAGLRWGVAVYGCNSAWESNQQSPEGATFLAPKRRKRF